MHSKVVAVVLAFVMAAGVRTFAQSTAPGGNAVGEALIPPDLVMAHQQQLRLSDAQRLAIQGDLQRAQARFVGLSWQLSAAVERLAGLLKQPRVDEAAALQQLDREQLLEHAVKRTQLQLMIEVKNVLTPEQQKEAFALKQGG